LRRSEALLLRSGGAQLRFRNRKDPNLCKLNRELANLAK
jgi:hypothetical protein